MSLGLVGKKQGMTRIFLDSGESVPVTVVSISANKVTQIKNTVSDGYNALQVATGTKKKSRVNKSIAGHFAKSGVEIGNILLEFRLDGTEPEYKIGDDIDLTLFKEGQKVDVTSRSKGKGFQGVVKRWGFRTQDMTHGNSLSHRAPGSIGQCQTPGRVFKGKKMCGQMGNVKVTVQSLEVIRVDSERRLIMIKGAVPGSIDTNVVIKPAEKCTVRGT